VNLLGLLFAFAGFVLLGVLVGTLTGLSPGLHVNNVAAFLLATRGAWDGFVALLIPEAAADSLEAALLLSCFLLATAASHTVSSFIPSVFLGAPTEDTALATLPGHRLLLTGNGPKAVALAARGAVLGTLFAAFVVLPLRFLLGEPVELAERFHPWTAWFLIGLLAAILATELRGPHPIRRLIRASWVQGLAATLGILTLRGAVPLHPDIVLFPLFCGLFGLPTLFVGLRGHAGRIPEQRLEPLRATSVDELRGALRGTAAGTAISWLPGLSGGAAATLASLGTRKRTGPYAFMVVLGAVSASTGLLSVAVLFLIHRTRSGVAAGVRELMGDALMPSGATPSISLLALIAASVLATALAAPLVVRLARRIAPRWSNSDPRRISALSILIIEVLLFVVTGWPGVVLAAVASLVGFVPIALRVRRIHLMASLLVPVVLTYLAPAA
jgi:putative membrane protein